ncbi:amino acid adenylation domain-containing protein [Nonomuraea mangrovi]|uniref:Amino acid adenylation domain-containing protein n=2 Tax=Nonomuraea TaxID=83681 RepID=A0ABW4TC57_9ACTN
MVERVHEAFAAQVRRTPEHIAVVAGTTRLTYAELNERAELIAAVLRRRGTGRGDSVGVCLDRDEGLLAALLGVLKTGAAYVPLDPAYPADRLEFIASDAQMAQLITSTPVARRQEAVLRASGATPLLLDTLADTEGRPSPDVTDDRGSGSDAAYVIYTSGSTGRPKGVVIEHRNAMALLSWEAEHYAGELDGMLFATSVCFDPSVTQMFLPLITGGTVIVADTLLSLPSLPARDEVTGVYGAPSALIALLAEPLPPSVRMVIAGGEPFTRALADRVYANPGVRRVVNVYGPTECTVTCTSHEVLRDSGDEPPIGTAYAGSSLSVRDGDGNPLGDGEIGELWVAGPLVGRGYLNRPDLTAERFVVDDQGVRHYRTGDLVRREGEVHLYAGRNDDQVKVAGFRVELGEVQGTLARHPSVNHAVVLTQADGSDVRRLIAYVETGGASADGSRPLTEPGLREWLRERLPDYMVPSRIAIMDRIPLGPTGKIDRAALPAVDFSSVTGEYTAPSTDTERRLADIVAAVLGLDRVGVHDHFTDLGGHSLAAARACAMIERDLGARVALTAFLGRPTVAELAPLVEAAEPAAPSAALVRHHGDTRYPLTAAQHGMWLLREVSHTRNATTLAFRLRLTGLTDATPVKEALDGLVRDHEVLRSVIVRGEDGEPFAEVRPPAPVPFEEGGEPDITYGFDLAAEVPLLRASLLWQDDTTAELVVVTDHIAYDGWSNVTLMAALTGTAGEPPLQVGDVALMEQKVDPGPLRAFWAEELAGAAPPYELAGRADGGPSRFRGARLTRPVPATTVASVHELAAATGTTPFAVYFTALGLLVAAQTDRPDVLLGAAVADRAHPDLESLVGPLVDVLPVRVRFDPDLPVRQAVARTAAATAGSLDNLGLSPQERLAVSGIERPRGAMLTPVVLSLQPPNVPVTATGDGLTVELLGELSGGGAQAPYTVFVNTTVDGVEMQLEYDLDLFDRSEAEAFADRLMRLLDAALAGPDLPVSAFELVSAEERAMLQDWGVGAPLPDGGPPTVAHAVLDVAAGRPGAPAVVDDEGTLTYGELAALSGRIASALGAAAAGATVGVCLPRDRFLPAALLGVARAGAAYVPVEPDQPVERLRYQLADAGVTTIVSAGDALAMARELAADATVLDLAELPDGTDHAGLPDPGDLAYVLYTSGSTGRPKGVEVTHANLAAFVQAMRVTPGVRPDDVMLGLTPFSFDVFGFDLWVSLACGLRLELLGRDDAVDGHAIARRIEKSGVTLFTATPTTLRMLVAAGWKGGPRVRAVSIGEVLDPVLAGDLLARVGEMWNSYGPTETTIYSTMTLLQEPVGDSVSIGGPLPGEYVQVLDQAGRLVPPGVQGELWIGGAGVARGYRGLRSPSFAEGRYRTGDLVRWRQDGGLDFLGRRDQQVKIRGHRIELGEIETALRELVADAAVAVHGEQLVGYLVGDSHAALSDADLRQSLKRRLPDHMIPRHWIRLDGLPTTSSGKLDRGALPQPDLGTAREPAPPATQAELLVADVWQAVLRLDTVNTDDDFFALGGHSVAATLVTGRLMEALALQVPVRLLFEHPTLGGFASAVEALLIADLEVGQ